MKTASPPKLPSFYVANPIKARECIYVTTEGRNVFSTDKLLAGIPHSMLVSVDDAAEGDFLTVGRRGKLRKMTVEEVSAKLFGEAA